MFSLTKGPHSVYFKSINSRKWVHSLLHMHILQDFMEYYKASKIVDNVYANIPSFLFIHSIQTSKECYHIKSISLKLGTGKLMKRICSQKERCAWKVMRIWLNNKTKDYLISIIRVRDGIESCADVTAWPKNFYCTKMVENAINQLDRYCMKWQRHFVRY